METIRKFTYGFIFRDLADLLCNVLMTFVCDGFRLLSLHASGNFLSTPTPLPPLMDQEVHRPHLRQPLIQE